VGRLRTIFFGTGDIGLPTLEFLLADERIDLLGVVTSPDRPSGRGLKLLSGPVAALARAKNVPCWQPAKIRSPELVAGWAALQPDLLVVMAYGKILPSAVLQLPRIAPWNLHASLLPRHRGASPIAASILAGDRESGITVMLIDEGLDTGDILLQEPIVLAPEETAGTLHDRLAALAPGALAKALRLLLRGELTPQAQQETLATYAGKISKQDGLIDWSLSVEEILRRIRAFTPWPGAGSQLCRGEKTEILKIGKAAAGNPAEVAPPGTVYRERGQKLCVAAGNGWIDLLEVQLPGKKMLPVEEFLRGNSWPAGARLGSV
jgi:methionyl-tRNA formyltransferase